MTPLLEIGGLNVSFGLPGARVHAVRNLSLTIAAGESLALIGASGSGKSATAFATMGLLPPSAQVSGSIRFDGTELVGRRDRELSLLRGRRIAMVHQDSLAALTPVIPVGKQLAEAITIHQPRLGRAAVTEYAVALLDSVGLDNPRQRMADLPHEFSGGMRQRVGIAMAIANEPDLLIADEPTSALDVTVAAQILDLLDTVRARTGAALLLITHDLGVVARTCTRVAVLDRGELVEQGEVRTLFGEPAGTRVGAMLAAGSPRAAASRPAGAQVLRVSGLRRHFRQQRSVTVPAVQAVDLELAAGQALALIGESGCGKSTVLREIMALRAPQAGAIEVFGRDVADLNRRDRHALRTRLQMVMQDPTNSLNPTMTVAELIAEPLRIQGHARRGSRERAVELLARVGLDPASADRRPGQLSGGQRQRVAIARALAPRPDLVLLDEPVSALDMPLRAGIMDLLTGLREQYGLAYLIVSHDISLTRGTAERVAVMYLGRVVEAGRADEVLEHPLHPYTRALVAATPVPQVDAVRAPRAVPIHGEVDAEDAPAQLTGCAFRSRCALFAQLSVTERALCASTLPRSRDIGSRTVACHHAVESTTAAVRG
ncbi:ABC transporter ATP-binding protein [Nocardia sp. NPDC050710]|uniref:ABC transporter ATP-binding protein n=1 Tax=Nocardia sp. NPDC050710 TaxID=3157220 RepID=UPI003405AE60